MQSSWKAGKAESREHRERKELLEGHLCIRTDLQVETLPGGFYLVKTVKMIGFLWICQMPGRKSGHLG